MKIGEKPNFGVITTFIALQYLYIDIGEHDLLRIVFI